MKPFDKKTTGSIGLWWDPNSQYFTSGSINLSVLKEFKGNVKIILLLADAAEEAQKSLSELGNALREVNI